MRDLSIYLSFAEFEGEGEFGFDGSFAPTQAGEFGDLPQVTGL